MSIIISIFYCNWLWKKLQFFMYIILVHAFSVKRNKYVYIHASLLIAISKKTNEFGNHIARPNI